MAAKKPTSSSKGKLPMMGNNIGSGDNRKPVTKPAVVIAVSTVKKGMPKSKSKKGC